MLTGENRDGLIVKAFRGGFSDFVSKKTLNTRELLDAIRGAVDRKLVERIEKREFNRLSSLSGFDSETGLYGIDFIRRKADELSASARRGGGSYGAIVICVRDLADINDAFGNTMRDRVFGAFAARIKRFTRAEDLCGRYNEESFLYLMDREVTHRGVWRACERLSADLTFVANFERASFKLAATLGMAFSTLDGASAPEVLAAAERALAHARETCVPIASASPVVSEPEVSTPPDEESVQASDREASYFLATRQVDRRCERRHRVVKQGQVIDFANNSAVGCRIRDISDNGARITVNEYYAPPDQFTLLIVGSGEKRAVKVRWRVGNDIGLQFIR
jgi:two-component system cell cycle response regulator